ncbi:MAG TPA: hypothetical protein PKY72_05255 [Bacilli bacterium]|nr:hypothetical protein [Bacilli bacterium]HQQ39686.1 hypothetical protein [Bacilli bacterium]
MHREKLLTLLKFKIKYNRSYFIVNENVSVEDQDIIIYKGAVLVNSGIIDDSTDAAFSVIYHTKPIGTSSEDVEKIKEGIVLLSFDEVLALVLAKKITPFFTDLNKEDTEILRELKEQ